MAFAPFLILFFIFGSMFSLIVFYILLRLFGLTQTNTSKKDRKIIEELGTEKINYSNPYFNSLAKGSKVGENLPTRNCDDCGAALNPDDRFCSICGSEVQ